MSAVARCSFFVPEVVQTSAMDCGPATLKCLLEGFAIPVSYGRLREACQTDVDGTSIDTMEEIAGQLGLEAEQTMLPLDHLLVHTAAALPCIVVVRSPNGLTHFVVAWRRHGPWVQLMDPSMGRRWTTVGQFLHEVYVHEQAVPANAWREWAGGEEFLKVLRRRIGELKVPADGMERALEAGIADKSWRTLAGLDAATRMVSTLVRSGGLRRGKEAARVLELLFERSRSVEKGDGTVPKAFWSVQPEASDADGSEQVRLRGAVLVRVLGQKTVAGSTGYQPVPSGDPPDGTGKASEESPNAGSVAGATVVPVGGSPTGAGGSPALPRSEGRTQLSPELAAALAEPRSRPARELWRLIRADGLLAPAALLGALALAAGAVVFEAIIFRGLFEFGRELTLSSQRLAAIGLVVAFAVLMMVLEWPVMATIFRLGRRLETRFRVRFLEKLPRLGDRYFQSRLSSDMAERSHLVPMLRMLPEVAARFMRAGFELLLTAAGLIWLDPGGATVVAVTVLAAILFPLLTNPVMSERDLRVRTHEGALARFYLDALLGLVPIRTHGAERAVRVEHESLLVEWVRAGLGLQRTAVIVESTQALLGCACAIWLVFGFVARAADPGAVLLVIYWGLNLPVLAQELALYARQYPSLRSVTLRLIEPLGAPEEAADSYNNQHEAPFQKSEIGSPKSEISERLLTSVATGGVAIRMQDVTVRASGHTILKSINLEIPAGGHVGIVGPSGAGKSSLVGLLLGWHRRAEGQVLVDGEVLDSHRLVRLRHQTAWVDPAVQLWNRTLLDNLRYGSDAEPLPVTWALEQADLLEILERLPDGLQARLGEGGGLLSGGEGQRVRFGRSLLRRDVRLVILDEPFRGLDREQRRTLLKRARQHWHGATLLCVTHDVGDTRMFDHVLVIEEGRLVEQGSPKILESDAQSRYASLITAEEAVRQKLWEGAVWRRFWLENGTVKERTKMGAP